MRGTSLRISTNGIDWETLPGVVPIREDRAYPSRRFVRSSRVGVSVDFTTAPSHDGPPYRGGKAARKMARRNQRR